MPVVRKQAISIQVQASKQELSKSILSPHLHLHAVIKGSAAAARAAAARAAPLFVCLRTYEGEKAVVTLKSSWLVTFSQLVTCF